MGMLAGILITFIVACVVTEFYGYWLHKLLHSGKVEFLSRNHMLHHLADYGPGKPLQGSDYLNSARDRTSILGVGTEWFLPVGAFLIAALAFFHFIGLHPAYQATFVLTGIGWGYLMFGYMHDSMHANTWMARNGVLKRWFSNVRKLHNIHHLALDNSGRMTKNFGICFFFFDRLFGSLATKNAKHNRQGVDAAFKRYAFIFEK